MSTNRSWEASQTKRLQEELAQRGNTREAWEALCDFHDLPAITAGILAAQCGLTLMESEDYGVLFGSAHERADEALSGLALLMEAGEEVRKKEQEQLATMLAPMAQAMRDRVEEWEKAYTKPAIPIKNYNRR